MTPFGSNILLKMAVSCTICEINTFLPFSQNFKIATRWRKNQKIFAEITRWLSRLIRGQKLLNSLYLTKFLRYTHFAFHAEIQVIHQKWLKNNFWKKSPDHSTYPGSQNCVAIAISHTVSDIIVTHQLLFSASHFPGKLLDQ